MQPKSNERKTCPICGVERVIGRFRKQVRTKKGEPIRYYHYALHKNVGRVYQPDTIQTTSNRSNRRSGLPTRHNPNNK